MCAKLHKLHSDVSILLSARPAAPRPRSERAVFRVLWFLSTPSFAPYTMSPRRALASLALAACVALASGDSSFLRRMARAYTQSTDTPGLLPRADHGTVGPCRGPSCALGRVR